VFGRKQENQKNKNNYISLVIVNLIQNCFGNTCGTNSSTSTVSHLKVEVNGEEALITENKSKATALLEFFSTVFTKEPDSDFIESDKVALTSEMPPLHITEDDILDPVVDRCRSKNHRLVDQVESIFPLVESID